MNNYLFYIIIASLIALVLIFMTYTICQTLIEVIGLTYESNYPEIDIEAMPNNDILVSEGTENE